MSDLRIANHQHPGFSSEEARNARARAWAYVFECKTKAAGVTSTNGDDAKKGSLKHEDRAETSLPR